MKIPYVWVFGDTRAIVQEVGSDNVGGVEAVVPTDSGACIRSKTLFPPPPSSPSLRAPARSFTISSRPVPARYGPAGPLSLQDDLAHTIHTAYVFHKLSEG